MTGSVNAGGEPARDREAARAQVFGELLRGLTTGGGRAAAADDRELRRGQQRVVRSFDPESKRGSLNLGEPRRIQGAAVSHEPAIRSGEPAAPAFEQCFFRATELADAFGRQAQCEQRSRGLSV